MIWIKEIQLFFLLWHLSSCESFSHSKEEIMFPEKPNQLILFSEHQNIIILDIIVRNFYRECLTKDYFDEKLGGEIDGENIPLSGLKIPLEEQRKRKRKREMVTFRVPRRPLEEQGKRKRKREMLTYRVPRKPNKSRNGALLTQKENKERHELIFRGHCDNIRVYKNRQIIRNIVAELNNFNIFFGNLTIMNISMNCDDKLVVNVSLSENTRYDLERELLHYRGRFIFIKHQPFQFIRNTRHLPKEFKTKETEEYPSSKVVYLAHALYFSVSLIIIIFFCILRYQCNYCCQTSDQVSNSRVYSVDEIPKFMRPTASNPSTVKSSVYVALPSEVHQTAPVNEAEGESFIDEDSEWSSDEFVDNVEFMPVSSNVNCQNWTNSNIGVSSSDPTLYPPKEQSDKASSSVPLYQCQSLNRGTDSDKEYSQDSDSEVEFDKQISKPSVTRITYDEKSYGFAFETDM